MFIRKSIKSNQVDIIELYCVRKRNKIKDAMPGNYRYGKIPKIFSHFNPRFGFVYKYKIT